MQQEKTDLERVIQQKDREVNKAQQDYAQALVAADKKVKDAEQVVAQLQAQVDQKKAELVSKDSKERDLIRAIEVLKKEKTEFERIKDEEAKKALAALKTQTDQEKAELAKQADLTKQEFDQLQKAFQGFAPDAQPKSQAEAYKMEAFKGLRDVVKRKERGDYSQSALETAVDKVHNSLLRAYAQELPENERALLGDCFNGVSYRGGVKAELENRLYNLMNTAVLYPKNETEIKLIMKLLARADAEVSFKDPKEVEAEREFVRERLDRAPAQVEVPLTMSEILKTEALKRMKDGTHTYEAEQLFIASYINGS